MRYNLTVLSTAVLLSACSPKPAQVVVQPGVPLGQAPQQVQPQDPQYAQPQVAQQPMQPQVAQQPMQPYAQQPIIVQQPGYAQPQQPVIVQQHDSGVGTAIMAGAAGVALGSMLSNGSRSPTYQAAPAYQAPAYQAPSRTVTNNTTTIIHQAQPVQPAPAPAAKPKVDIKPNFAPARPAAAQQSAPAPARPATIRPATPSRNSSKK